MRGSKFTESHLIVTLKQVGAERQVGDRLPRTWHSRFDLLCMKFRGQRHGCVGRAVAERGARSDEMPATSAVLDARRGTDAGPHSDVSVQTAPSPARVPAAPIPSEPVISASEVRPRGKPQPEARAREAVSVCVDSPQRQAQMRTWEWPATSGGRRNPSSGHLVIASAKPCDSYVNRAPSLFNGCNRSQQVGFPASGMHTLGGTIKAATQCFCTHPSPSFDCVTIRRES